MNNISFIEDTNGIIVRIPMKMKKRGGRKEITVPNDLNGSADDSYNNAFAIAISRGYCWSELLESGKYGSIREMAEALGVSNAYMRRLLRFTLLAPDIIASIINGSEPDGFSQNKLTGKIPANWEKQREKWSFLGRL